MNPQVSRCPEPRPRLDRERSESDPQPGERTRLLDLLEQRLQFETLLARLSSTFIHLTADAVDAQIERGLQQIVEFLQIERSGLGQFSEDGSRMLVTHHYTVPGFPPFAPVNLAAALPWYTGTIRAGTVTRFSRLPDDLPPEAAAERQYCVHNGIRAQLTIPFAVGASVLGGLGFTSFRRQRDWPDDLVQSLRLVAEIFANALARRHAEEESRRLRERLAHVGRVTAMGELAASIAHEVNQPLCAIISNAQTLERVLGSEGFDLSELREAVADITRDGQRASAVIARIRDFLQKAPTEHAPVQVNDVIREVSALMRSDMARRGIATQLELAEPLPCVPGRRIHLQQVLVNLMANAADAMDPVARQCRRLVMRSTQDEMGTIAVAVQDTGVGIDPGSMAHIFDAFFTTKPGGIGMGLAICKSIVEAHGGTIGASPNSERGTTIHFTLPADLRANAGTL